MAMTPRGLHRVLRWWPPFVFSGIRVLEIADDWSSARIELRRRWYTANYVGTHFGGSLFAMTDPFWMLMVIHALGRDYIVWDKAGEIEFLKPGRGTVRVHDSRMGVTTLARKVKAALGIGVELGTQSAQALDGALPIIAVGGILSGADAREKIDAGATLVQLYTGLIYRGPALVAECARATAAA